MINGVKANCTKNLRIIAEKPRWPIVIAMQIHSGEGIVSRLASGGQHVLGCFDTVSSDL